MKKNIFLIMLLLLLTGCKNELVCTLTKEEESYLSEQKITFTTQDDKVNKVITNYTMTFENKETAEAYLNVLKSINEDNNITLNENEIELTMEKNYKEYDQTKEEVKQEFEKNGYSCK